MHGRVSLDYCRSITVAHSPIIGDDVARQLTPINRRELAVQQEVLVRKQIWQLFDVTEAIRRRRRRRYSLRRRVALLQRVGDLGVDRLLEAVRCAGQTCVKHEAATLIGDDPQAAPVT